MVGYLKPSHHGQRIMSEALSAILWDWAVPRMGARRMLTTIYAENRPSIKVALMNGFSVKRVVEGYEELRGEIHNCVFYGWNMDVVAGVKSKL
jgi:RimJ/RimL family protein N-acetyltransferase